MRRDAMVRASIRRSLVVIRFCQDMRGIVVRHKKGSSPGSPCIPPHPWPNETVEFISQGLVDFSLSRRRVKGSRPARGRPVCSKDTDPQHTWSLAC